MAFDPAEADKENAGLATQRPAATKAASPNFTAHLKEQTKPTTPDDAAELVGHTPAARNDTQVTGARHMVAFELCRRCM